MTANKSSNNNSNNNNRSQLILCTARRCLRCDKPTEERGLDLDGPACFLGYEFPEFESSSTNQLHICSKSDRIRDDTELIEITSITLEKLSNTEVSRE
jgi:hypothetical protein